MQNLADSMWARFLLFLEKVGEQSDLRGLNTQDNEYYFPGE
jgi:hypothetical protein